MNGDQLVDAILILASLGVVLFGISHMIWPEYYMRGDWNWKGSYLKDWPPIVVRLYGVGWVAMIIYAYWR